MNNDNGVAVSFYILQLYKTLHYVLKNALTEIWDEYDVIISVMHGCYTVGMECVDCCVSKGFKERNCKKMRHNPITE